MWGPFATAYLLGSNIICYLLSIYYEWECQEVFIFSAIINFVLLMHCFYKGEQMGDFVAYKKILQKESFFISYLLEYLIVSPDVEGDLKSNNYIEELLNSYISVAMPGFEQDEDEMYVLYEYLTMLLAGLIKKGNISSQSRLEKYIQNISLWMDVNHPMKYLFMLRIIQYLHRWVDKKYAKTLYERYVKEKNDLVHGEYEEFIKQTKYVMGLLDVDDMVLDMKNIRERHIYMEAKYLDEIIDIENRIVNGSK